MKHIADLRKSYESGELDEARAADTPLRQFDTWLQEALSAGLPEPNAMTVATVSADGRPSTRVVLIKGYDPRGIVWYTNYDSRKGRELAGNPFAALQFHWVTQERVVRIEGRVEKTSAEESDAYYASPARLAPGCLGLAAEPADQLARGAGGQRGAHRRRIRPASAAPAALGRLPAGARSLGVLAGPQVASARSAGLPAGRRHLAARAAGALIRQASRPVHQTWRWWAENTWRNLASLGAIT